MAGNSSSDVSWVEQNMIVGNGHSFAAIKADGSVKAAMIVAISYFPQAFTSLNIFITYCFN